jgi:hypothetical protein
MQKSFELICILTFSFCILHCADQEQCSSNAAVSIAAIA